MGAQRSDGFGWLRHMRAADTALARANARALVKEFLALLSKPAQAPRLGARSRRPAERCPGSASRPCCSEGVDYRRSIAASFAC